MKYRQIWEEANGPIPVDELGRSFHIHHVDGDRRNNRLENLRALSAQDHYDLHLSQGDYGAAFRLSMLLKLDPKTSREHLLEANRKRRGVPRPEHEKQKISKSMLGKTKSEAHRQSLRLAGLGKKRGSWYHSPTEQRNALLHPEQVTDGWVPGRFPIARTKKYKRGKA